MTDAPENSGTGPEDGKTVRAGEYVLGLLRGSEREAFEAEMARDHDLADQVSEWEQRFVALTDALPEETPPAAVWQAIRKQIGSDEPRVASGGIWRSLGFWRGFGMAATAALLGVLVWTGYSPEVAGPKETPVEGASHVAVVGDGTTPYLLIAVDASGGSASVYPLRPFQDPAGKAHELWMVPDEGKGTPVSLGTIDPKGSHGLNVKGHLPQLPKAVLAVSLEPAGGSPTGQPTGKVVWHGKVAGRQ